MIRPLGGAVGHELDRLPPVGVAEQHDGLAVRARLEIEGQRGANPFLRPFDAAPGHPAVRNQLDDLHHRGRIRPAEEELKLPAYFAVSAYVACPPSGQAVPCGQRLVDASGRCGDAHAVPDVSHVVLLRSDPAPVRGRAMKYATVWLHVDNKQPNGCMSTGAERSGRRQRCVPPTAHCGSCWDSPARGVAGWMGFSSSARTCWQPRPTSGPRPPTTTPTPCSTKPSRSRSTSWHRTRCSAPSSTKRKACLAEAAIRRREADQGAT